MFRWAVGSNNTISLNWSENFYLFTLVILLFFVNSPKIINILLKICAVAQTHPSMKNGNIRNKKRFASHCIIIDRERVGGGVGGQ